MLSLMLFLMFFVMFIKITSISLKISSKSDILNFGFSIPKHFTRAGWGPFGAYEEKTLLKMIMSPVIHILRERRRRRGIWLISQCISIGKEKMHRKCQKSGFWILEKNIQLMFVMIQIKTQRSKGKLAFLGIQLDKGQHHLGFLPKWNRA